MVSLAIATGWLPSQIEAENYADMARVVMAINARSAARADAAKEVEYNRMLIAERRKRGMTP